MTDVAQAPGSSPKHPIFFATPKALRAWLRKNYRKADETWVGLYKKASGRPSITWPELVDQLLCFGWIDGIRKTVDEEAYAIRVTPRRPGSIWSRVNLRRVPELIESGEMTAAGRKAYEGRDEKKTERYSYDRGQDARLGPEYERVFRANRKAWTFWQAQPPGYRKTASWYVISAKREETRRKRLERLIADSERGERIGMLKKR